MHGQQNIKLESGNWKLNKEVFFRSKFSNTFNCWFVWDREITLLQVELIFHGPMLPNVRCSGPITEAQNLKSFSANRAKQNRVDHPLALSASRCGGLSVLHPSHYPKLSENVNGHARSQQVSPQPRLQQIRSPAARLQTSGGAALPNSVNDSTIRTEEWLYLLQRSCM